MININKFKNIISNLDNYRNIGKTLPEINGIRFNYDTISATDLETTISLKTNHDIGDDVAINETDYEQLKKVLTYWSGDIDIQYNNNKLTITSGNKSIVFNTIKTMPEAFLTDNSTPKFEIVYSAKEMFDIYSKLKHCLAVTPKPYTECILFDKGIISTIDGVRFVYVNNDLFKDICCGIKSKVFDRIHNVFDDDYTMQISDKYIRISDTTGNVIVSKLLDTGMPDVRQYIHRNDEYVTWTVDNSTIKDFKYLLTGIGKVKKPLVFDGDVVSCGNVSINGYNWFKNNKVGVNCRYVLECLNVIKGEVKISRFKNMIKISNDDVTEQICEIKLK